MGTFIKQTSTNTPKVLFITYDGLLDPLGGSQITPYLYNLSREYHIHILSFEKSNRLAQHGPALRTQLLNKGILWTPLVFTSRWGKIGKLSDLLKMHFTALHLCYVNRFQIIHCRSYLAAQSGFILKSLFRCKLLFDMRGFWVDERVEGGLWPQRYLSYRLAYSVFKQIEQLLLKQSDYIVTLTNRSVSEVRAIADVPSTPLVVIPCCTDFDEFVPLTDLQRQQSRSTLGIRADDLVVLYLGSLGTWYQFDEMLLSFNYIQARNTSAVWLVVTKDWNTVHEEKVTSLGGTALREKIVVKSADRAQLPQLIGLCDVMLSYIKPSFSKLASSPIKLGEAFAMGLPTISSPGIGDVDQQVKEIRGGLIIDTSSQADLASVAERIQEVASLRGASIRNRSRVILGLEVAIERYRKVYSELALHASQGTSQR